MTILESSLQYLKRFLIQHPKLYHITMSTNEADSRRAVNERIVEAGSNNVSAMVEAGKSSQKKRAELRAAREAEGGSGKSEKAASEGAASKADAVRAPILSATTAKYLYTDCD